MSLNYNLDYDTFQENNPYTNYGQGYGSPAPRPPAQLPYVNYSPQESQDPLDYKSMGYTAAQSNGSMYDTLGNAGMASGNPYLMAGGAALKLYGAYSDSQAAEKKEAEERRRQNRIDAYNRLSAERSNTRNQQTHDQNMRSGDFNYGTGVQDRLLYLAGYKGV